MLNAQAAAGFAAVRFIPSAAHPALSMKTKTHITALGAEPLVTLSVM